MRTDQRLMNTIRVISYPNKMNYLRKFIIFVTFFVVESKVIQITPSLDVIIYSYD